MRSPTSARLDVRARVGRTVAVAALVLTIAASCTSRAGTTGPPRRRHPGGPDDRGHILRPRADRRVGCRRSERSARRPGRGRTPRHDGSGRLGRDRARRGRARHEPGPATDVVTRRSQRRVGPRRGDRGGRGLGRRRHVEGWWHQAHSGEDRDRALLPVVGPDVVPDRLPRVAERRRDRARHPGGHRSERGDPARHRPARSISRGGRTAISCSSMSAGTGSSGSISTARRRRSPTDRGPSRCRCGPPMDGRSSTRRWTRTASGSSLAAPRPRRNGRSSRTTG